MSKIISPLRLLRNILKRFKIKLLFWYHNKQLKRINNVIEFYNYLGKVNWHNFYFYKNNSLKKRKEFMSVVDAIEINLKGINFLDIGPGYGDSLDICHERGAAAIHFIEHDPFFFHYNRLKGFTKGYYCSHITSLHNLSDMKYHFIWLKGSINVEHFIKKEILKIKHNSMHNWLNQLEILAAPSCHILICPQWDNDGKKRLIDDVHNNIFTNIMMEHNYKILPEIKDFCGEVAYPIAFYKFI
jgi:hypothetical protein